MQTDHAALWPPNQEVVHRWGLVPLEYLSGLSNQHWLVESGGGRLVLTGYLEPFHDIEYELEVLRRLRQLGWPVPEAVVEPVSIEGRTWCLFTWLAGASRLSNGSEEKRARGRLLAELHDSMALIAGIGQRDGFGRSDEVIRDPELVPLLRDYERMYPIEGRIMRWRAGEL